MNGNARSRKPINAQNTLEALRLIRAIDISFIGYQPCPERDRQNGSDSNHGKQFLP